MRFPQDNQSSPNAILIVGSDQPWNSPCRRFVYYWASVQSHVYIPGDKVPVSGIYAIEHDQHRLMHQATLSKDMSFPLCRTCGTGVRFTLVRAVRGAVLPFRTNTILEEYPEGEDDSSAAAV